MVNHMEHITLSSSLKVNIESFKNIMGNTEDLIIRELRIGLSAQREIVIIYIDGLADEKSIHQFIMEPLMLHGNLLEIQQSLFLIF
jgi:spore germination protein KA